MLRLSKMADYAGEKVDHSDKWYSRYPLALFSALMAWVCFMSFINDVKASGLGLLLFNPVMGIVYFLSVLVLARELALVTFFVGGTGVLITMFPVVTSLAILTIVFLYLRDVGKKLENYERNTVVTAREIDVLFHNMRQQITSVEERLNSLSHDMQDVQLEIDDINSGDQ